MKAMAQPDMIQYLKTTLKEQVQFTTQELIEHLPKVNPEATAKTHSWRINRLKTYSACLYFPKFETKNDG